MLSLGSHRTAGKMKGRSDRIASPAKAQSAQRNKEYGYKFETRNPKFETNSNLKNGRKF
jgi:hypothetical protein